MVHNLVRWRMFSSHYENCSVATKMRFPFTTLLSALLALHIYHSFVIAFLYSACSKCGTFGDLLAVLRETHYL